MTRTDRGIDHCTVAPRFRFHVKDLVDHINDRLVVPLLGLTGTLAVTSRSVIEEITCERESIHVHVVGVRMNRFLTCQVNCGSYQNVIYVDLTSIGAARNFDGGGGGNKHKTTPIG